ncbi:MAG TPA: hypothetical protein VN743_01230 [Blastocatellia bacterium]|nr:hypothetical protein [Blastocatellia bacterium]
MLVSTEMITGFNTDVRHQGQLYHVQTEDRGKQNPILESLVYIGGTIIAKKLTSYSDQLDKGAGEDTINGLLKRQHQVVIAAIKAGRIEDLISHTRKQQGTEISRKKRSSQPLSRPKAGKTPSAAAPSGQRSLLEPSTSVSVASSTHHSPGVKENQPAAPMRGETGGLNLDNVIADYLERASGAARLDVKVLTPSAFTAGKNVGLRVQVTRGPTPETEAVVTVKIIGTAFKPQVFIGRAGSDGIANFTLALPSFTTGTAAIVIEAQSGSGRGELKNLIRRA